MPEVSGRDGASQVIDHAVDPSTIQVGQRVRFECPVVLCGQYFWHIWIADDAASGFCDPKCWMHKGDRVYMRITEVVDANS